MRKLPVFLLVIVLVSFFAITPITNAQTTDRNTSLSSLIESLKKLLSQLRQNQTAAVSDFNSSLVAHYEFEGNVNDSKGGNNGTAVGNPTYVVGKVGQAISTNANFVSKPYGGSFVELPRNSIQIGSGDITVSAWANYQATTGTGVVIATQVSGGGGQIGYSLGYSNTTRAFFEVDDGSISKVANSSTLSPGWHHIVGVFKQGESVSIYVDGILQQSQTSSVSSGNIVGSTPPRIGDIAQFSTGDSRVWLPFKGHIDDVRVYNKALSSSEIGDLYALGGGSTPTTPITPTTPTTPTTNTVSVSKVGNGTGTVTGTGINCGSDCTETLNQGVSLTLNASPTSGSIFSGWSGGGCSGTGNCSVTVNSNTSITATFSSSAPVTGAPIISNVYHKRSKDQRSVTISWQTNEPADSQIEYGLTTSYGSQSNLNSSLVTNHSQTISVNPNSSSPRTYNYRIKSKDGGGATGVSQNYTFTLLPAPSTSGPQLCKGSNCVRLQKNMTWAFLGDSITSINLYNTYIEMYFHLRYPELDLQFREEARSGSTIGDLLPEYMTNSGVRIPNSSTPRFLSEVYPLNPQADIMSIMWAGNGGLTDATYRDMLSVLIDDYVVGKSGATPILLGGIPYYSRGANMTNNGGVEQRENDSQILAAQARGLPYVDLWRGLGTIWKENYLKSATDPTKASLQGIDDHLGPSGHVSIAHQILTQLGAEAEVSSATIDAGGTIPRLISQSNTTISGLSKSGNTISFSRADTRSPFIIPNGADEVLKMQPNIYNDLSRYMLKVTNLAPGTYRVLVDGVPSATIGSNILGNGDGWNMSNMKTGPIYNKAINVLNAIHLERGDRDDPATVAPYFSSYQDSCGWFGEANYRSNASAAYGSGLRGEDLRNRLTLLTHGTACVSDDLTRANQAIWNAAAPQTWNFTLERIGDNPNFTDSIIPTQTTDSVFPSISITSPINNANLTGTVNLTANATDNIRVASVQFKVDGNNVGIVDTSAPFSYSLNSATLTNGNHTITAVATDSAGNATVSTGVNVSVSNLTVTAPIISGGTPTGTLARGTTQATLSVVTNEPATCKYSTSANTAYASMTNTFSTTGTRNHSVTLTGLTSGNRYTYYVRCSDVEGNTNVSDYPISFSVSNQTGSLRAWSYPGIPYTDWAYDPFTHPAPTRPTEWPSAAKQNYYFIAPDDINATDTVTAGEPVDANGKRFGYPNKPRKTLPLVNKNFNSFPAGTVFWMKGGDYDSVLGTGVVFNISSLSTPDKPFWIYGDPNDKPVFRNARIQIYNSTYGFVENIIFDDGTNGSGTISFGRNDAEGDTHHITIRNIDIQNRRYVSHGGLLSVNAPVGKTVVNGVESGVENGDIHDIVFYKINFKNNGRGVDWNAVDADMHGYKLNGSWNQNRAYRIWIIENDVRKGNTPDPIDGFYKSLAGNFAQVGDQNVNQGNVDHVWIAGNYSEGSRQGCVGLKRSGHVVVSSNVCKNLAQAGTSQGQAFNTKYDRQENQWFVNNYAENVDSFFIRAETTSSGAGGSDTFRPIDTRVYVIGNVFKDTMREPWNLPDMGGRGGWKTKGISIQDMNGKVYVANNVIDTSVYGVYFSPHSHRQSIGSEMHVYNNIAVNLSAGLDTSDAANNGIMITTDTASEWFIENNFVDSGRFYYSGTQYNSADAFNARVNASGNKQGNPMFTNPAAGDYTLRPGSPAIDSGVRNYTTNGSPEVYQLFINAFSNDPDFPGDPRDVWPKDFTGANRIAGSSIDLGAFEYGATGGGTYTPPPSNNNPPPVTPPRTDTDSDGVLDSQDLCPSTPTTYRSSVNRYGCIRPTVTGFDTRPDVEQDLRQITNLRFGRTGIGEVRFLEQVNLLRNNAPIDVTRGLSIERNKVSLDSNSLPELNKRAEITLITTLTNPKILKDGTTCTTCIIRSFTNNTIIFEVPSFSTYEVVEGDTPPTVTPEPETSNTSSGGRSRTTTYGTATQTTTPDFSKMTKDQAISWIKAKLIELITELNVRLKAEGKPLMVVPNFPSTQPLTPSASHIFNTDLYLNINHPDVWHLQRFLNTHGYPVGTNVGSYGKEVNTFGPVTKATLQKFQQANGIPATGYFGPETRARVNGMNK